MEKNLISEIVASDDYSLGGSKLPVLFPDFWSDSAGRSGKVNEGSRQKNRVWLFLMSATLVVNARRQLILRSYWKEDLARLSIEMLFSRYNLYTFWQNVSAVMTVDILWCAQTGNAIFLIFWQKNILQQPIWYYLYWVVLAILQMFNLSTLKSTVCLIDWLRGRVKLSGDNSNVILSFFNKE